MKQITNLKLHKGITLIETIIVIAISMLLVLAALRINSGRGRQSFDNGMKEFVAQMRQAQSAVQAGLGPDISKKVPNGTGTLVDCAQFYPTPSPTNHYNTDTYASNANKDANGDAICPFGNTFGIASLFMRNDDPDYSSYNRTVDMLKVGTTGTASPVTVYGARNFFQTKTGYANFLYTANTYPFGGVKKINLPDNIAYLGACAQSQINAGQCVLDDYTSTSTFIKPINVIFGKSSYGTNQALTGTYQGFTGANSSNLVLGTFLKRCGFFTSDPETAPPNCKYSFPYMFTNFNQATALDPVVHDSIIMRFSDLSYRYQAKVTIKAQSNEINLELQ